MTPGDDVVDVVVAVSEASAATSMEYTLRRPVAGRFGVFSATDTHTDMLADGQTDTPTH